MCKLIICPNNFYLNFQSALLCTCVKPSCGDMICSGVCGAPFHFLLQGGGNSYIKKLEALILPFRGLKAVLIPLKVFSLERSIMGVFKVPFGVLNQEKHNRIYMKMLSEHW